MSSFQVRSLLVLGSLHTAGGALGPPSTELRPSPPRGPHGEGNCYNHKLVIVQQYPLHAGMRTRHLPGNPSSNSYVFAHVRFHLFSFK